MLWLPSWNLYTANVDNAVMSFSRWFRATAIVATIVIGNPIERRIEITAKGGLHL